MTPLCLVSEPFSISGSATGRTLEKAVANSPLEQAEILLRETLQNSLDARISVDVPVGFRVSGWRATPEQVAALRKVVFAQVPPLDSDLTALLADERDIPLLLIADDHTRGLGGPTRADLVTDEAHADFRDFFLNVGREAKKGFAGGTFGLGRGVLFEFSEVGVVIAYTRTESEGYPVRRLMAMALSEDYEFDGRKFTGRHWWGECISPDTPNPVVDSSADAIARELSMDVIPEDTTGTALLIVAPRLTDGLGVEDLVTAVQEAALLYAWPHMLAVAGTPMVDFAFEWEGQPRERMAPSAGDSPVRRFAEAYRLMHESKSEDGPSSWREEEILFKKGQATPLPLGRMVFRHFPPSASANLDGADGQIPKSSVAVMRGPRIVVKYMGMPEHPRGSETAGVFVADSAFEGDFAAAEPVAHDDWIPTKLDLQKFGRNPVKQALEKMRKAIKDSWQRDFRPTDVGNVDEVAVGLATMLGGLVAGSDGIAPPKMPHGGGRGGSPSQRRVTIDGARLEVDAAGRRVALFDLSVKRGPSGDSLRVMAVPRVLTDSGREPEDQGPVAAPLPTVVGWVDVEHRLLAKGDVATLPAETARVSVAVLQPDDVAVALSVRELQDDEVEQP